MSDVQPVRADVVVFGGGVAGLWLLGRLRAAGFRALLLEANSLGSGQTRYAQGIIHGGTKYALTGEVGEAARAVAAMPAIWRASLEGTGELDLRNVRLLSHHQYLWSTASLTSRMAGFFASHLMRSRTAPVPESERPAVFHNPAFRGQVYRLDEPVLDTATLVDALATPHRDAILKIDWPDGVRFRREDERWRLTLSDAEVGQLAIDCDHLVFAAGRGNGELLAALGRAAPTQQLRPLQMVMLRGDLPKNVYAHCLAASTNPRITISTHHDGQGRTVWYLGGQLAEDGVGRTREEQIAAARKELEALLPWVDLTGTEWGTLEIERAEPRQADGSRPDTAYAVDVEGVIAAWPTKLALAPKLAADTLALLERAGVRPSGEAGGTLMVDWPRPQPSLLPWQEEVRWN